MSEKKNTPTPPKSDVHSRTTYTVQYEIDGVRYKEDRSLDTANGDFLGPLGIKKVNEDAGFFGKLYTPIDPESVEGKKVMNSMIRRNKLVNFAKDWAFRDDTSEAAFESGYVHYAREGKLPNGENASFINEPGVPNVEENDDNVSGEPAPDLVTPEQIFSNAVFKENLKYPVDMVIDGGQDYMFIEQFAYSPPQPRTSSNRTLEGEVIETEGIDDTLAGNITQGLERRTNLSEAFGTCKLPIPNRLDVSNGVNWGEGRANAVEMGAFSAATSQLKTLLSDGKGLGNLITNSTNQATKTFGKLKEAVQNQDGSEATSASVLNAIIARSVLSRIGINVDVDQFITRQTGAAINPNLELLFGGPQLRTFTFNFDFAPNSTVEAVEVRKIQRWFRQGMLPQRRNANASRSLFLGSPNIFRLCYLNSNRRIKGLNTFKICALTSCQVSFTPDGVYQSYEDASAVSMPVRSTMGLTFNELTPIFANDYDNNLLNPNPDPSLVDLGTNILGTNGFTDDDIGF
jgi:hypothetical protein